MKLSLRGILKKAVAYILVCIVGFIIVNKAIYSHVHKLDNGSIIVHAHPYDKSENNKPENQHQHSKTVLFLWKSLEILFLTVCFFFIKIVVSAFKYQASKTNNHPVFCLMYSFGRAPPCIQK